MIEEHREQSKAVEQSMSMIEAEFGERLDEAARAKIRTGIERERECSDDEPGATLGRQGSAKRAAQWR